MHFTVEPGRLDEGENHMTQAHLAESGPPADFDAIIVGAGFAGLYVLH
jgi:hypothetical protein